MAKLYCIENLQNGKKYVGFTTQSLVDRFEEHKRPCLRGKYRKGYPLYEAFNKYGIESFICYEIYDGSDALEKEDGFIQLIGDYNAAPGGGVPPSWKGRKRTVEHQENLNKALRGIKRKPRDQSGSKNPMFGKAPNNKGVKGISEETRVKMRLAKLGKKQSPEHVAKRIQTLEKLNMQRDKDGKFISLKNQ